MSYLEDSLDFFKKYIVESNNIDELLSLCFSYKLGDTNLRPIVWRICFNLLPMAKDKTFKPWIEKLNVQRSNFSKKLKKFVNVKKISGDPLGGIGGKKKDVNKFLIN